MKNLSWLLALVALSLFAVACGEDEEEKDTIDEVAETDQTTGCCPNAPASEFHISITGQALDLTTNQGVAVALAPIAPMDAIASPTPTHISESASGADGLFSIDCFDVSSVALGMVVLADDAGFDGTGGTYFPTSTGVKAWETDEEKVCVEGAAVFAVPNTMVAGLDQLPDLDSATEGFAMGLVLDANKQPVAGATLQKADGTALAKVYYPNPDLTDFAGGGGGDAGLFIMPASNFTAGVTEITAVKEGMTFGGSLASAKPGFCYFFVIQPE